MADPTANLIGGMLTGFTGMKNQAQQTAMMNDYRKAQVDLIKTNAKLEEQKLNLTAQKDAFMQKILGPALEGNSQAPAQAQPLASSSPAPFAQYLPSQPQAQPKPSIPDMVAQGLTPGGITIPGNPANNISVRQNNPFNLKYVGQPEASGAGTRGFAIFDSPETGIQAGIKQIQLDQSRNLPFGQFAEKYAPAYENPTWKNDVSKLLGGIPDNMPISQIPTLPLAQAIAQRESSLHPGAVQQVATQMGQPQQPQAQPQPQGPQTFQNNPNLQPPRSITQKDAIAAAWKYFTGADLRDEKYDYRVNKAGDIMVLKDGQLYSKIHGGPDISWHTDPQGNFVALDRTSLKPVAIISTAPEMIKVEGQTPSGAPYTGFIQKPKWGQPGGMGTPQQQFGGMGNVGENPPPGTVGGVITGPGIKDQMQKVPEAINQKLSLEYDPMIRQLEYLKSNYVGPKGTDKFNVFGYGNQLKFQGAETPAIRTGMEAVGANPSPELIDFHKTMKRLENFEVHNFGGSNLTYQELKRALAQIPRSNNPKDFAVAVDSAVRAYNSYKQSVFDFYSKTENQRTNESLMTPPTPPPGGGRGMQVNPQTQELQDPLGLR